MVASGSRTMIVVQMYRWFPSILKVLTVIRPETLVRWHRAGFRRYYGVVATPVHRYRPLA